MSKQKPLIDESGEVRELTAADLPRFKPAPDVLPAQLHAQLLEMNFSAATGGTENPQIRQDAS